MLNREQNMKGLRGATCDVMIAEEAAYLNPKMFMEAMVPLMSVDGTAFLGITSPGDEQNHFSLLQSLKDPKGEDLFFNIKIGLICEPCLEARLTTCRHNLRRLPPWKSEARHDIVRAIYGHNKEIMAREACGMSISGRNYLFSKADVDFFEQEQPLYYFTTAVPLVEVGMDPSGGGRQSSYTIVSRVVIQGKEVVSVCVCQYVYR